VVDTILLIRRDRIGSTIFGARLEHLPRSLMLVRGKVPSAFCGDKLQDLSRPQWIDFVQGLVFDEHILDFLTLNGLGLDKLEVRLCFGAISQRIDDFELIFDIVGVPFLKLSR
jgi:hypothetical protein